ncbi:5-oxopent-3-ene-1,2,5-tricarboxylate decarboxylase [Caballeronia cordobensis]|uniref:5-oxopent-3-ene-1,2,5-tricarboxylate decarboxylase n=1 Tax=Caballeronia cordobensis TaxID=1353886 RepID=A0A158ILI5_CABCO|nr:fumarylacetoacetate hydrolase family protein [Caballeronia cordobensis]SAL57436.1 5-oxopent-3-ene-1,2,5-tricarboxylate decarboxylase [Caballeronia cordobensis]
MSLWIRYTRATAKGEGRAGFGMLENGRVVEYEGDMFASPHRTGQVFDLDDISLTSPCVPSRIVALWNNFHALSAKLGKALPAHPLFLIKPSTSLAGPGDTILRPAGYGGKIVYEGELGIVIGKRCSNVSIEEAADYVFGYTVVNDVTAAELLFEDANFPQWCRAKGYDTFGCIGPAIATALDWQNAHVVTTLDGVERQNYPLADMAFSPLEQVSLISRDMTLLPGDVIACGTSLGVGSMRDGATVEVSIEGIGTLTNHVSEVLAKT